MYYHAAKLLLKTRRPVNRRRYEAPNMEFECDLDPRDEILLHARAICGITTTNPVAQALIIACHLVRANNAEPLFVSPLTAHDQIIVAGAFFNDKQEQDETFKLLEMAQTMTGHPCTIAKQKLREVWAKSAASRNRFQN